MVEITLVEVHLENAQFDANAEAIANAPLSGLRDLFGGSDEEDDPGAADADDAAEPETEPADSAVELAASSGRPGPSLGKLFLGVLLLAVVGIAARRLLGGDGDGSEPSADDEIEIAEIGVGE